MTIEVGADGVPVTSKEQIVHAVEDLFTDGIIAPIQSSIFTDEHGNYSVYVSDVDEKGLMLEVKGGKFLFHVEEM